MEQEKSKQQEFRQKQQEQERLHQENTKKLVKRINMVEIERKVAKDQEKQLQESLKQKQKELQQLQEIKELQAKELKEQQKQMILDKESQMNEQLSKKEREMKEIAVDIERRMKEELQRKQDELFQLKEESNRQVQQLKFQQDQTIQNKEMWLAQQLLNKEKEIKQTLDSEIGKQHDIIQRQREENLKKENELNQVIQEMKQIMTQQEYEYKMKEQQIKDQQQKLLEMKEEELKLQLKQQQEEFNQKNEEQQMREKKLMDQHAKEIQLKEQNMKAQIDMALKELDNQKYQQNLNEQKLIEKQNELLRQQEESMISQASQQQKNLLESLRESLEEQYKHDLERRLQQQQQQAEELINEYEQKQQIEIQRLQEMSMKEQEETQSMMEELLEQKEREKLAAEQQALERIKQEQEIRQQLTAQSSQYLEALKEQLKREQMEKNEIRRLNEETKQLYERQLMQEKEKIQREKDELERKMKERERADAAEIDRLRKSEIKLKEFQEERKKRRKEKKERQKKDEQSNKIDQFQSDVASVSTFAQPKAKIIKEKSPQVEENPDQIKPINLKNHRVLQPQAQTDSAQKGFDHVQGLFLDDVSSAASIRGSKIEKKDNQEIHEIKEVKEVYEVKEPQIIQNKLSLKTKVVDYDHQKNQNNNQVLEIENIIIQDEPKIKEDISDQMTQNQPNPVKSKLKIEKQPSNVILNDFESNKAPQIIESRLSPRKMRQDTQPAKLRFESVRRDDATIIQIKQPENINYEGDITLKDESKSIIDEQKEYQTNNQLNSHRSSNQISVQQKNNAEEPEFSFPNDQEDQNSRNDNQKLEETLQFTQKTSKESPLRNDKNIENQQFNDTKEEKELLDQIEGKVEKAESTFSKQSSVISDKRPLLAHLDQIAQKKRLARLRGISPVINTQSKVESQEILNKDETSPEIAEIQSQDHLKQYSAPATKSPSDKILVDEQLEEPSIQIIEESEFQEAQPMQTPVKSKPKSQISDQKSNEAIEEKIPENIQKELDDMRQKEQNLMKLLQIAENNEKKVQLKAEQEAQLKLQKEKEAEEAQKKLIQLEEKKIEEMNNIQEKIQKEVQEAIMRQMMAMQEEKEKEMKRQQQEIENLRKEVEQEKQRKLEVEQKMKEETERAREEERQKFKQQESQRQEKEQLEKLLEQEIDDDVDNKLQILEEEQEWQQIQREKQEQEKQWKQFAKENDEHLKSLKNSQVQTEKMRQELKQLEQNKRNRDLADSAVARIAGEMIICHIENTIQEIYDTEIQNYLNSNRSSEVEDDSHSEANLLMQIEEERRMVEEQRKQIQSFIEHEKQDSEQRQRLSLVEQEQQNILQQKRIQEEQRLLEEKIRNLEIQKQIHDLNMQREQIQMSNLPQEYLAQTTEPKENAIHTPPDMPLPEYSDEPIQRTKSSEKEVKKRRSAFERKKSGLRTPSKLLTLDNQSVDWQQSQSKETSEHTRNEPQNIVGNVFNSNQPSAEAKREYEKMTAYAKDPITPDVDQFIKQRDLHTESINPFDLAGSCISRPSRPSNPLRPQQENVELPKRPQDMSSRNIGGRQTTGTCPFQDKNKFNDGINKSQVFEKGLREHESNPQQLFDELTGGNTRSIQKKKSINNLDQFEQISSADSRENYKQSPSNAQSTPSLGKYAINEQIQENPTINLVIHQEVGLQDSNPLNSQMQSYSQMASKIQRNSRSKPSKHNEPEDSFDGIDPALIFSKDRPPIIFVPRRNNKIDQMIANVLQKHDLRVPVVPIRPGLYLIGPNRVNVDCKFEQAMVKVGAGTEKLEPYLVKSELISRNKLIDLMNKSGKDLKWVVNQLKEGKQIKTAEFKDLVVKRQNSGTLFSIADTDSVANSRHSKQTKKHEPYDHLYSAGRTSDSPSIKRNKQSVHNRVRQFDQLQAPTTSGRSPNQSYQKKDSFTSSQLNHSGVNMYEHGRSFKNPKTKGIQLYPGDQNR